MFNPYCELVLGHGSFDTQPFDGIAIGYAGSAERWLILEGSSYEFANVLDFIACLLKPSELSEDYERLMFSLHRVCPELAYKDIEGRWHLNANNFEPFYQSQCYEDWLDFTEPATVKAVV